MSDRRKFLKQSASVGLGIGLVSSSVKASNLEKFNQLFLHHVFFWLKNPDSYEDRKKFETGLKDLITIETIKVKHIGIPAETAREVIDNTYHYSLFIGFKDKAGHDVYQKHKKHLDFIEKYEHLLERVLVYDSINI